MSKYSLHLSQSCKLLLRYKRREPEGEELHGEDCFTEIEGTISGSDDDIGYLKARLIHVDRADDSLWYELDGESGELEGFYRHVFGKYAGVMRSTVAKVYDQDGYDMFLDPVLYIEKIEVSVAHRGRGVGLMAMNALLAHFRHQVTLAFCKPYPLHFDTKHKPDSPKYFDPALTKLPRRKQIAGLQRYWSKAGFTKLGRGPYYVVNVKKRSAE
jgi:hypothetical protein